MRILRTLSVIFGACLVPVVLTSTTLAQEREIALSEAIDSFAERSAVGVVYAGRLVRGLATSCTASPGKATGLHVELDCILAGTGISATWTRSDQVVLARVTSKRLRTLTGRLMDGNSGDGLPGAHVMLPNLNRGVASDADGWFALDGVPDGALSITFSHLGYQPVALSLGPEDQLGVIALHPQTIESEAVVVEEDRATVDDDLSAVESLTKTGTSSRLWLTGDDLDLGIAASPGLSRTGEISGQFVVRGGLPDQNVVRLDGAPVYQPWHSQGLFSVLQPASIRTLNLYSGPLPADQGGYLASVLDAEFASGGSKPGVNAAITTTLGEVSVSTPLAEGLSGMVSARRSHQGLSRTHALSLPNSQPLEAGSFYDVAAKLAYRSNPSNYFSFTTYRGGDNMYVDDTEDEIERGESWRNGIYSLKHRFIGRNRLVVNNTFYVSTFDELSSRSASVGLASEPGGEQHIRDAGFKIDVDYGLSDRHMVKTGVEVSQHHIEWRDGSLLQDFRDEVLEGAAYVQDTWTVANRLRIRPGMRLSWFGNGVGMQFEPRFHAQFAISGQTQLHGAWSRQVQYVHHVSNIVSGGQGATIKKWIVSSNQKIRPSSGHQANLGITTTASNAWTLGVSGYWRHYDGIFLPRDTYTFAFPLKVTTINETRGFDDFEQGETKAYGIELTAAYRYEWFRLSMGYAGSRSVFRVPSQILSDDFKSSTYDTPHAVRSSAGFESRRFTFSVSAEARTGYPTLASVRGAENHLNGARLPTYFRLDAALGYRFSGFGANWDVEARVYNITDRQNVVGYEFDDDLMYLQRTSLLGVTRWPTFRVKMSL